MSPARPGWTIPTGQARDLSEADAATRTLAQAAVRCGGTGRGVTGQEFSEALRMLGLLETPVGDARSQPLGGTRRSTEAAEWSG